MTWTVTASDITDRTVSGTPSQDQTDWATLCADAVNAAYETALNGYDPASPSAAEDELSRAALLDGIAAFKDLNSPYGILSVGPDGDAVRVGYDVIRAGRPVIDRYAVPGIA